MVISLSGAPPAATIGQNTHGVAYKRSYRVTSVEEPVSRCAPRRPEKADRSTAGHHEGPVATRVRPSPADRAQPNSIEWLQVNGHDDRWEHMQPTDGGVRYGSEAEFG